ncbi:arrestin domain-containing protein 15-like [Coccinella septempunctata]|uniref:arrestin domain-containing protein 15-like n=1 Tax=Coccinella septempunctata TaxID=41139 RepID=UPI001D06C6A1|nr:arrestin domain-containing protein 15-like [Coccinella septempunctata]
MTCKLELINKEPFYVPGSYIEGKLNCSFSKKREIELIEVRFFGRESANYKVTHEVLFNSDRSICYTHTVILRSSTVERGKRVFNFKIQIPSHIPSTYVSEYGSIRYHLEGLLMLTQTRVDSSQVSIQIFSPIDVKSFSSDLHRSAKITEQKDLLGICGGSGHISAVVQVEKKVFLCGESINMNVTINNSSGVPVRFIRATLTKSASCKLADGEYDISKEKMIISKKFKANVGKGEEKTVAVSLKIPEDLQLPNLKHSELFKMKYWMHVCIIFQTFWHRPLDICFKVYLGHLPLNF